MNISEPELGGVLISSGNGSGDGAAFSLIEETKQQNCQNGTYGTQSYKSETVGLCVLVASYGSHADAHGHDERNSHRACCNSA